MFRTILFFGFAAAAWAAPKVDIDPQAILRGSDEFRNATDTYVVRLKISNFGMGKKDDEHLYQVSQKGADKTHVEFLSPREKGQFLLMLGDNMWVYLPGTSRPVRITPLERLTGNASNGDVARTHYSVDYDAVYLRTEMVDSTQCHVLDLTAKRKGSTYRRIELWVRVQDSRPVKANFFLASGKHIKSTTYDEYQQVNGATVIRRMTIYDQLRTGSRSVMEYSQFAVRALPDKLFSQGRMDR